MSESERAEFVSHVMKISNEVAAATFCARTADGKSLFVSTLLEETKDILRKLLEYLDKNPGALSGNAPTPRTGRYGQD